jgi:hypothetical protein
MRWLAMGARTVVPGASGACDAGRCLLVAMVAMVTAAAPWPVPANPAGPPNKGGASHSRAGDRLPVELPALAQVPLPEGLEPKRVLDDGRIDGYEMAMHSLKSAQGCEGLLDRVQILWRARLAAHVLGERGDRWLIASAAFADGFITLQLRRTSDGGCEGFLSRWPMVRQDARQAVDKAREVLRDWPPEVTVLRQTDEQGGARVGSTISAQSALPVPRLLELFRTRVIAQGFVVRQVLRSPGATPLDQSVLVAGRRDVEITVFLNANGELTDVAVILERKSP